MVNSNFVYLFRGITWFSGNRCGYFVFFIWRVNQEVHNTRLSQKPGSRSFRGSYFFPLCQ
ncbi:hypothetical protein SAMN04488128_101419 [Chitinophaga eiseniae]|uniref:Uncharacterized protein n=1 Tax=Chitinophaga eiseniae TaxID=634771 RepID=A0A1T4L0U3_9BACT|nr:hypothetical protein SAMN04488128_101419 [Chitinophaga eiseniae]